MTLNFAHESPMKRTQRPFPEVSDKINCQTFEYDYDTIRTQNEIHMLFMEFNYNIKPVNLEHRK